MEKFGERLKTIRRKKGITVASFAQSLGMTNDAVLKLESGSRGRTLEKLPAIAKALGCRIDDLFPEMDGVQTDSGAKHDGADGFVGEPADDDDSLDGLVM